MMHVYEFEMFEGPSGMLVALPYDLEGGTQGEGLEEACEMAADWLQAEMEHRAMHDLPFPKATFGNEPSHPGGRTVIVAVNAGKDTVRKMSASDAARKLGVSPGRVTQMVDAGLLDGFKEGHKSWVTEDSVLARLADAPKAGRPKKAATA